MAPGLDEKMAAIKLEQISRQTNMLISFTVVTNAFVALEHTEHTDFDAIFISDTLTQLLPYDFMRIMRSVGSRVPIILLHSRRTSTLAYSEVKGLPCVGFGIVDMSYSATLQTPFTSHELCELIRSMFQVRQNPETIEESEMADRPVISTHPFFGFSPFPFSITTSQGNNSDNNNTHLMDYVPPSRSVPASYPSNDLANEFSLAPLGFEKFKPLKKKSQHRGGDTDFSSAFQELGSRK
ncbi:hypothetical protein EON65_16510 [archaeon]|nr:MAG: hypothetical protein EON65_16510 [archaeon]